MITSLEIKGFKCFSEFRVEPLSRVTVLGGQNGVGKTSLLEAVFLFFDRLNPEMIIRQFGMRGIRRLPMSAGGAFASIFHNFDLNTPIEIAALIDNKRESLTLRSRPSRKIREVISAPARAPGASRHIRTDDRPSEALLGLEYRGPDKVKLESQLVLTSDGLALKLKSPPPKSRQAVFIPCRALLPTTDEDCERFGKLDVAGKVEPIVQFLAKFDSRVRDLSSVTLGEIPLLYADIGLDQKVPVPLLGDGISRLLSFYLAIATTPGGVVLIDEIGSGIHYSAMSTIWEGIAQAAEQFDCQILATTHSYECLKACTKAFSGLLQPDFAYVRLDSEGSAIRPKVYPFSTFVAALDRDWEVR
jgi:hypothetical protein